MGAGGNGVIEGRSRGFNEQKHFYPNEKSLNRIRSKEIANDLQTQ